MGLAHSRFAEKWQAHKRLDCPYKTLKKVKDKRSIFFSYTQSISSIFIYQISAKFVDLSIASIEEENKVVKE